jgi:Lrp/AsnC family transcriptional regulator, regulator for asnA, asnC and gidA
MKERQFQPDERDWQIIDLLRAGTISSSAVAEKLGVSEGMIRQRIKRMRDAGVLSLRGLINPDILADRQIVILGAKVASSRQLAEKAEEVAALPDVLSVSIVSGRYDIMIELLLDSHRGLVQFLTEELSKVDGIQSTESFVTLRNYSKFV